MDVSMLIMFLSGHRLSARPLAGNWRDVIAIERRSEVAGTH
jgi:hypothetical protein